MNTLLILIDWIGSLNKWQLTLLATFALVLFWSACAGLAALFVRGGYHDERDEEEGDK